ncbi:hypothetical protein [Magnetococcus sp. PR-3]|uniref:hypothetical protein n=1 Tax=Magnetococcus sp. PR-3 TaxID=3120355 RepID=UPI002FCDFA61
MNDHSLSAGRYDISKRLVGLYALFFAVVSYLFFNEITIASSQDNNFVHVLNVYLSPERWQEDLEGNIGGFITYTLSYWLPALMQYHFSFLEPILAPLLFAIRPILVLFLFVFILKKYSEQTSLSFYAASLLLFGHFSIFLLTPAGYDIDFFSNYYAQDVLIPILLGLYFLLKKRPVAVGLMLFISLLTHPAQATIYGLFFLFFVLIERWHWKQILILGAFAVTGSALELYLLDHGALVAAETINDQQWWQIFEKNGHLNAPFVLKSEFILRLGLLGYMSALAFMISTGRWRRILVIGLITYAFALALFMLGAWLQIATLMQLAPLRYANFLILLVLLVVGGSEYQANKRSLLILFAFPFLVSAVPLTVDLLHIHSLSTLSKLMVIGLIFMLLLAAVFAKKATTLQLMVPLVFVGLIVLPVAKVYDQVKAGRPMLDMARFIQSLPEKKGVVIMWGNLPTMVPLRTATGYPVLDVRRKGSAIYSRSVQVYQDDQFRAGCYQTHRAPLTEKMVACLKEHHPLHYVLSDLATPVEGAELVYANHTYGLYKL